MKKAETMKHKKWLKARRRSKRIKKQHNYETKTKRRVTIETIREEAERKNEREKKEKVIK